MNEHISQLIEEAGFSNTYEIERLTRLCKITALSCTGMILGAKDVPAGIAAIVENFSLEGNDGDSE